MKEQHFSTQMLKINFVLIDLFDLSKQSIYFLTMKYSFSTLNLNFTYELKWSIFNSNHLTYKNGDF